MKNHLYKTLSLLLTGVLFTSCLKDDRMVLDPEKGHNVIEFANVTAPTSAIDAPFVSYVPATLELVPESEFTIKFSYSGPETKAPEDIVIELGVDPDAIETFNTSEGTDLSHVPDGLYELPSSVTIKKGENKATATVKIKPDQFDALASNAIAITIKSVSSGIVSANFGTAIFSLPIKSIWEGTYDYHVISNTEVGEKTLSGIVLSTVGPNRVRVNGLSQHYSGWAEYQFNADNTTITETAAFSGRVLDTRIEEVILVDPENGIFEIRWIWLGREVTETYTKTGD